MPTPIDPRTERNLNGVHPDLCKIVRRAFALHDASTGKVPVITEGVRTLARQKQLLAAGASKTLRSRHLTGHAVDVAFFVGGKLRWDWPLYKGFADTMKRASRELKIPVTWGGSWAKFRDGPHFELPRDRYPAP